MERILPDLWGAEVWTDDQTVVSTERLMTDHVSGALQHLFHKVEREGFTVRKIGLETAAPRIVVLATGEASGDQRPELRFVSATMFLSSCQECKSLYREMDPDEEDPNGGHESWCRFQKVASVMGG